MGICITDESQKTFKVQYCASDYSVGTNTTSEVIIRVEEIESGRTMQDTFSNVNDRFSLSTNFFNSFNTYVLKIYDTDLNELKWTFDAVGYDSYKVSFIKMSDEDCGNYIETVNIG